MHPGEAVITAELVRRLLADQLPHVAGLSIEAAPAGTVNAIFRVGEDLCARLPRVQDGADDLVKELRWLPELGPHLSLTVPEPVASGKPAFGYPFPWAVYRWIDGEPFPHAQLPDDREAAADLAAFVGELRAVDPSSAPRSGRKPLRRLDFDTRAAIASARGVVDARTATAAWESCLQAPEWDGAPVWRHCDLLPPNLLVGHGRLKAVLDFGGAGVGDPAIDVVPAWAVFGPQGRAVFRSALDVDDGTWTRARGLALHQALLIIPYYPQTHPAFVAMAKRTVREVIADWRADETASYGGGPRP